MINCSDSRKKNDCNDSFRSATMSEAKVIRTRESLRNFDLKSYIDKFCPEEQSSPSLTKIAKSQVDYQTRSFNFAVNCEEEKQREQQQPVSKPAPAPPPKKLVPQSVPKHETSDDLIYQILNDLRTLNEKKTLATPGPSKHMDPECNEQRAKQVMSDLVAMHGSGDIADSTKTTNSNNKSDNNNNFILVTNIEPAERASRPATKLPVPKIVHKPSAPTLIIKSAILKPLTATVVPASVATEAKAVVVEKKPTTVAVKSPPRSSTEQSSGEERDRSGSRTKEKHRVRFSKYF
jgi:hypothetical protein